MTMHDVLNELSRSAAAGARKAEIKRWTARSVEDHVAQRFLRTQLEPTIPIIDGSVDATPLHYDPRAWKQAVDFYREVDRTREDLGDSVRSIETGDGFRSVASSEIDELATALLRFTRHFFPDRRMGEGRDGRAPAFLDMGCHDGRVVVLASLLGYRTEGIEIDSDAYRESLDFISMLDREIPGIARTVNISNGDYCSSQGLKGLLTRTKFVDVFFNYDDTNVDRVADAIVRRGKPGARLLLHSYAERKDQIPLKLTHMVMSRDERRGRSPEDYFVFDVFVRDA